MKRISKFIFGFQDYISFAQSKLTKKQFLFFSSILVGLSSGIVAVSLKLFVHYIFEFATHNRFSSYRFFYLILPAIGILLTLLIVKRFFNNTIQKGLAQIHFSLSKRSSFIPRRNMFDQFFTSSLTVGFGGSTGLEAPIVITGAAFGSNFAKKYGLHYKERTLLLACGIAAGIAAAFNAPIAGVLFALEVLMVDIGINSFTLLIISAATGALVSKIVLNEGVLLSFILTESFNYWNLPYYVLLGLLSGIMAFYHSKIFLKIEQFLSLKIQSKMKRWGLASLLLIILIAIFPPLFGEGYQSIKILAVSNPIELMYNSILFNKNSNEILVLVFIGLLIFLKSIATAITIGGGGNGGSFAPSLFIGAYLGYFLASLVNILKINDLPRTNFMMVGMAGILSGLYHAPLTAIFLIAEITGGYGLMIPLMIVASISFLISRYLDPFPMDSKKLILKGEALTTDKDLNVLTGIKIEDYIEKDFEQLNTSMSLGEFVKIVSKSKRNIFPVIEQQNILVGIVLLDDVREVMFNELLYNDLKVLNLMRKPKKTIFISDSMATVMNKFDESDSWILPVTENHTYVGFIAKSKVFTGYRNRLKEINLD
jgi:CIC family chloride channel protein